MDPGMILIAAVPDTPSMAAGIGILQGRVTMPAGAAGGRPDEAGAGRDSSDRSDAGSCHDLMKNSAPAGSPEAQEATGQSPGVFIWAVRGTMAAAAVAIFAGQGHRIIRHRVS